MEDVEVIRVGQAELLPYEARDLLTRRGLPLPAAGTLGEFWIAVRNDELVGLAGMEWHGAHGLLRSVAVEEGVDGQGVGTLLVCRLLDRFLESRAQELYLLTTGAEGFFARLGFVPVERDEIPEAVQRSPEFQSQCPSTATVMKLDRRRLETVRFYDRSAARVAAGTTRQAAGSGQELPVAGGCCGGSGCGCGEATSPTGPAEQASAATDCCPSDAADQVPSWGCTLNPLFGEPGPGEVVLDLGCGAGRNVFEAARRVGPEGHVYGLDLSPVMLAEARSHRDRLGLAQVSFLQAPMEAVPLPDGSVDLVISDCVLNLSTDKARVLREAYRVLRPGGRLAIADVVRLEPAPAEVSSEGWCACVDGAVAPDEYLELLKEAGFRAPSVEVVERGYGGGTLGVAAAHVSARR